MKHFSKLLGLLLATIFVLTAFVACQPADPTPGGDGTPAETPVETEPPKDPLTLSAEYVVVRPDPCSDAVKDAAISIKDALAEATGGKVSISEDFLLPGKAAGLLR